MSMSRKLAPELEQEFQRWCALSGDTDPYDSDKTLGIRDILKAHFLIADFFLAEGSGIGGIGPRSLDLLHSAAGRPLVSFGGKMKWTDPFDTAATLLYGLVMNHAFHDANKRTAFLCTLFLLQEKIGRVPKVSQKVFEDFLVDIAEHKIKKRSRYKEIKKENNDDPEVLYISHWLRTNTRPLDKRQYTITFRDLKRILNKFGYGLENPHRNYIDVVQYRKSAKFFGYGDKTQIQKLGVIGYPGETRQVQKGDLKSVRRMTGLDAKNGYDSQVFYKDEEPLDFLIAEYQEPLRRLADR